MAEAIHMLGLPKKHKPTDVVPSVHYQTQTDEAWTDPIGTFQNGDVVIQYNSTMPATRVCIRSNNIWVYLYVVP